MKSSLAKNLNIINVSFLAFACMLIANILILLSSAASAQCLGLSDFERPFFGLYRQGSDTQPKTVNVISIAWEPRGKGEPALSTVALHEMLFGNKKSVKDWLLENSMGRYRIRPHPEMPGTILGPYLSRFDWPFYWRGDPKGIRKKLCGHEDTFCPAWNSLPWKVPPPLGDPHRYVHQSGEVKYLDDEGFWGGHTHSWAEAIRRAAQDFDLSKCDNDGDTKITSSECIIFMIKAQGGKVDGTRRWPKGSNVPSAPLVVDGSGRTDFAVLRKNQSKWQWIVDSNYDGASDLRINFGNTSDYPIPADYHGDDRADFAILADSGGLFRWLIDANRDGTPELDVEYGRVSDKPVPADYDGDGRTDFAVIREVGGQWQWIVDSNHDGVADLREEFGKHSDTPVPGDYDGDGRADLAVVREVGGQWQWIVDSSQDGLADLREEFGKHSDTPVLGDYDGDGRADLAVVREVGGQWQWIVDSNHDGVADLREEFGIHSDTPVVGDYDGDAATDFAVVREVGGQWQWIVDSNHDGVADLREEFGNRSDQPLPANYHGITIINISELYAAPPHGHNDLAAALEELLHQSANLEDQYPDDTEKVVYRPSNDPGRPQQLALTDASGRPVGLDPYHRLKWGWLNARVVNASGHFNLKSATSTGDALILHSHLGANEFFILENRWRGTNYDSHRNADWEDGLALWHVIQDPTLHHKWARRAVHLRRADPALHEGKLQPGLALFRRPSPTTSYDLTDQSYPQTLRFRENVPSGIKIRNIDTPGAEMTVDIELPPLVCRNSMYHIDFIVEDPDDFRSDFVALRQVGGQWQWIVDSDHDGTTDLRTEFGKISDRPIPGDYHGNSLTDFAVVRAVGGQWQWIVDSNHDGVADLREEFGNISDRPMPGNYAGNALVDFAVIREAGQQLEWIADSNHDGVADLRREFGNIFDRPMPGDYDGDGRTDFAVVRAVGGQWQWIVDSNHDGVADLRLEFGKISDRPILGNFDGDGRAEIAVVRAVGGQWQWIVDSNHDGVADLREEFGNISDRPMPVDYDGDGRTDFAVVREVGGQWQWIVDSNHDGIADLRREYGRATDIPLPF